MAFVAAHSAQADHHSVFAAIGEFFTRYAETRSHHAEIVALEAMSDDELAEMGLTRDGIFRHVFSDSFYL